MKEIAAAKFKEQCLALLDEVGDEGIIKGDISSTGIAWDAES